MKPLLPAAVLFDLDGTLIDTAADFHYVINLLLAEHQRPPVSYELLRQQVSNGARAMVETAFNTKEQDPDFPPLLKRMLTLYLQHLTTKTQPFPGITELLNWLGEKQIAWGIVTNKPEVYTTPIMRGLNFNPAAGTVICPDHVNEKKPHPESLFLACRELGVEPGKTIYIGDHRRDIEAGRRAGMQTIAASYGYLDKDEDINSWNSHFQVDHASEIRPILETIYSHTQAS